MRSTFVLALSLATLTMAATHASARGGPGGGGPPGHAGGPLTWQGSNPPGFSQGGKTGWNNGSVPPGWSKGKKKGWRGRNVPPGLYAR